MRGRSRPGSIVFDNCVEVAAQLSVKSVSEEKMIVDNKEVGWGMTLRILLSGSNDGPKSGAEGSRRGRKCTELAGTGAACATGAVAEEGLEPPTRR